MSGFEVEIADMDLIQQVFDRQKGHMDAIKAYVSGHCTTPGGFGIVLQPLAPHYERAYNDGVTGLGSGATVAQACSTKIVETKTSLLETDRKQYERYARHEADMGHNVPPYTPPPGGGTLPAASSGYTPEGEEGEYPKIDEPYKWIAEHAYDAPHDVRSATHTPAHAAPEGGEDPDSSRSDGGHTTDADSNGPGTGAPSNGSPDSGSSDSGSSSGSGDTGGSGDGGGSSGSGDSGGSSGSGGSGDTHPRHAAPDEPNVVGKATEIYNAPGDYIETGKDVAETVGTRQDLNEAENGPVNDDQTEWANSGRSF